MQRCICIFDVKCTSINRYLSNSISKMFNSCIFICIKNIFCLLGRINSIKEKDGESWKHCEDEVETFFREKVEITNRQNCHSKSPKSKNHKNSKKNQTRTIICWLLNYKAKENILKIAGRLKGATYLLTKISPRWNLNTEDNSGRM